MALFRQNEEITEETKHFSESFHENWSIEDCKIEELINECPILADEDAENLEKKTTVVEASRAAKRMKNGKSSGSDGFTTEFFKVFW